jgi:hypothetical protein
MKLVTLFQPKIERSLVFGRKSNLDPSCSAENKGRHVQNRNGVCCCDAGPKQLTRSWKSHSFSLSHMDNEFIDLPLGAVQGPCGKPSPIRVWIQGLVPDDAPVAHRGEVTLPRHCQDLVFVGQDDAIVKEARTFESFFGSSSGCSTTTTFRELREAVHARKVWIKVVLQQDVWKAETLMVLSQVLLVLEEFEALLETAKPNDIAAPLVSVDRASGIWRAGSFEGAQG